MKKNRKSEKPSKIRFEGFWRNIEIMIKVLFIVVFAGCGTKPEPDRNSRSAVYESETVGDTISEETEGSENSEEEAGLPVTVSIQ